MPKIAKQQPVDVLIDRHTRALAGLRRRLAIERNSGTVAQIRQAIIAKEAHIASLGREVATSR